MSTAPTPKGMVDVSVGVATFYEIVQAADEFEAFMAKHNSFGGSVEIHISIAVEWSK